MSFITYWEASTASFPKVHLLSICRTDEFLKVTEDADICKLFAVAVGAQREQERPLEAHEAPHTGQVEAPGVSDGLFVVDGNTKESNESHHSQDREENPNEEEELEAF